MKLINLKQNERKARFEIEEIKELETELKETESELKFKEWIFKKLGLNCEITFQSRNLIIENKK